MSPTAKSSKNRPLQPCLTALMWALLSGNHHDLAEEIARLHERFGLAQPGKRKGAHLRLPDPAFGDLHHPARHILLGIAVRPANLYLALPDVADIRACVEA